MSASGAVADQVDDEPDRETATHGPRGLRTPPAELALDALVGAARALTGGDAAALTALDGHWLRVWARSGDAAVGATAGATADATTAATTDIQLPSDESLCALAVAAGSGFFEVVDGVQQVEHGFDRDLDLAPQALALGLGAARAYAAVPWHLDGRARGSLCVMSAAPRSLSAPQREQLQALGRVATALLGLHHDHERGQALRDHEIVRQETAIAERTSREKSEFLSRISHELRTPLNAILGFAQLMTMDVEPPLSGLQWNRLDGVRQAGRTLLALIDELLELAQAGGPAPGPAESPAAAAAPVQAGVPPAGAPPMTPPQSPASSPPSWPAAAPTPSPAEAPAPARPPRVVLYVEDEPLNIVLMQEIFRAQPEWTLHVARDGTEGVEMALALRPDLALIDMNLPDFNGIEVLRRLRLAPSLKGLRCIALSADAMAEQITAARAAGFDDYWTKPIDLTRLLAAVARVLDGP